MRTALHKDIAAQLSERIVSGEYPEKSLLPPERSLCEIFGVSRTVVREAVKLLESRGLVSIEHGRGTLVRRPGHEQVSESLRLVLGHDRHSIAQLLEVRTILETGMSALAAERRSPGDLEAMRRWLEVMRAKPGEPEGYVEADLEFHAAIARAANNPVLTAMLTPLADLLRESRRATFSGPRVVRVRTAQHERIFERIRAGDARGARTEMLAHLEDTRKDLERL
ncbi:MAG: FadR family transcriptional regulator [Acidobacteriia bacterium]|nr:FadR family transcriptional regulator [Terriglobia bacterium]